MTRHRVLGTGEGIPWHLPRDQQHFRQQTDGKVLLLGRRTFEEMDGWFTNQLPIVLTHQSDYKVANGLRADTLPSALALAEARGTHELMVCGGGQVYESALPIATHLILTIIEATIEGKVCFPRFRDDGRWHRTHHESFEADAENTHAMTFEWWQQSAPVVTDRCDPYRHLDT